MALSLEIRYFAHSWVSDWNHGNAHFLRGLARELVDAGQRVRCYEQLGAWSLSNLMRQEGERGIRAINEFRKGFPQLDVRFYQDDETLPALLEEELRGADIVIIHEWNSPKITNAILSLKKRFGFRALFHDTHHRAYTAPGEILRCHLHLFDGVLAFGGAIQRIYSEGFGLERAWTFHEAADCRNFRPLERPRDIDVLWIGNWGDEERSRELREFLIRPAAALECKTVVHGVRYPEPALEMLAAAGIEFRGYIPNLDGPEAYARTRISVHIPRRQYANGLSGIPTIRVFEALACGVPLVCSPWNDSEGLFRPGEDYVVAADGTAMENELAALLRDDSARRQIAASGLGTILEKHTCRHRARQLMEICEELGQ
ncbi:MAG: glycosyltransferase [Acidobacteria bacterium]|nr:glycosyltransferase [Acidobacteriota bacterium]